MSRQEILKTIGLPLIIVAAPSIWMFASLPPLWRDFDAYVQTVYPPGAVTILLHGPLYCTLSRIPLWLGYRVSGSAGSLSRFIYHPQLTDAGVFALIAAQHVALWSGALYLITAVAQRLATRVCLALFFAAQPLFYAFAHCVGSESLSLVLMLFIAGAGLRLASRFPRIAPRDWIAIAALLCCSVLTRKINVVLAALLPATFGLLAVADRFRGRALRSNPWPVARVWLVSCFVSLASLLWATAVTHLLCWNTGTPWRSKFGYTFIWRLNFLQPLPPPARAQLLDAAAAKCRRADGRLVLGWLRDWLDREPQWQPDQFAREARTAFGGYQDKARDRDCDLAFNDMARAFLLLPPEPLRSAALADFADATRRGERQIVQSLFLSTTFFFRHQVELFQCAKLRTFRLSRESVLHLGELGYLRWWAQLSYGHWLALAFVLLLTALILNSRRADTRDRSAIIFAICFAAVGALVSLLTCFFARFVDRFMLPMLASLLISIIMLLGTILRASFDTIPRSAD